MSFVSLAEQKRHNPKLYQERVEKLRQMVENMLDIASQGEDFSPLDFIEAVADEQTMMVSPDYPLSERIFIAAVREFPSETLFAEIKLLLIRLITETAQRARS